MGLRSIGIGERLLRGRRFHPLPAVHLDRLGDDLEHLFRRVGAHFRLLPRHRGGARQGLTALGRCANPRNGSSSSSGARRSSSQFFFAYFSFLSLKAVHPVFDPLSARLARRPDRAVSQHFRLYRRDLPRRAEVDPAGRYRGGRRLRASPAGHRFRRVTWPTMLRLAWPAYTNEAIFLVPRHHAGVLLGLPRLAATGRRALLRKLLRRQDLQPVHPLPDPRDAISSC